jgi:hypothetical protein
MVLLSKRIWGPVPPDPPVNSVSLTIGKIRGFCRYCWTSGTGEEKGGYKGLGEMPGNLLKMVLKGPKILDKFFSLWYTKNV